MDKFETTDLMVAHYKMFTVGTDVYRLIIQEHAHTFLNVLRSKTNKPSEHDLLIIRATCIVIQDMGSNLNKRWTVILISILEFYSNRK